MKIGNIIFENKLVNHEKVDYVNYYQSKSEYENTHLSLPTLFVGWNYMKKINPDNEIIQNANILKKKIVSHKLYWEFSYDENKKSHVNGVNSFVNVLPEFYFGDRYHYTNLDPVFFNLGSVDDVMDVLPKEIDQSYQFMDEQLYIIRDNKITGIDLNTYNFYQFDIDNLIKRINERTIHVITDENGEKHKEFYKIFPNYIHLKRHLVTILTK